MLVPVEISKLSFDSALSVCMHSDASNGHSLHFTFHFTCFDQQSTTKSSWRCRRNQNQKKKETLIYREHIWWTHAEKILPKIQMSNHDKITNTIRHLTIHNFSSSVVHSVPKKFTLAGRSWFYLFYAVRTHTRRHTWEEKKTGLCVTRVCRNLGIRRESVRQKCCQLGGRYFIKFVFISFPLFVSPPSVSSSFSVIASLSGANIYNQIDKSTNKVEHADQMAYLGQRKFYSNLHMDVMTACHRCAEYS